MSKRAMSMVLLDEDVVFDILSRLPAETLLELRRVCKAWDRAISDPAFVRAQALCAGPTAARVSGFVFQGKVQGAEMDVKKTSYVRVGDGDDEVARVNGRALEFLPDDAVAVAGCGGLVCCRSCFPVPREPEVFVCNPSTGDWISLPTPVPGISHGHRFALALHFNSPPAPTFTLVRARNEEEERFEFDVYSSGTKTWRTTGEVCQTDHSLSLDRGVVHLNGTAYWLLDSGDTILAFTLGSELSVLAPVPEFDACPERACIGESNGKLHYATLSGEGLAVWCLEDLFGPEWALKHYASLESLESGHPRDLLSLRKLVAQAAPDAPWAVPVAFHAGFLLMAVGVEFFLYCFATGKLTNVSDNDTLGPYSKCFPTVLPYSPSLVRLV